LLLDTDSIFFHSKKCNFFLIINKFQLCYLNAFLNRFFSSELNIDNRTKSIDFVGFFSVNRVKRNLWQQRSKTETNIVDNLQSEGSSYLSEQLSKNVINNQQGIVVLFM
jgi:hypothetical protein